MKSTDSKLAKRTALVFADQIASNIPGLNIAWGLTKALFGRGMELRQDRALEWVEMVRDNPKVFTKKVLESEEFQDGFVYATEKYIRERNEKKRKYAQAIFLDFGNSDNYKDFELERAYIALEQLTMNDVQTLRDVDIKRMDQNYQIYGSTDRNVDSIFHLITLGILREDISPRYMSEGYRAPFVNISEFGKSFVSYLKEDG